MFFVHTLPISLDVIHRMPDAFKLGLQMLGMFVLARLTYLNKQTACQKPAGSSTDFIILHCLLDG